MVMDKNYPDRLADSLSLFSTLQMASAVWKGLARTTPTIAQVPHRALLSITGPQSTQAVNGLLNGLLTTKINGPFRHHYTALLHPQVRIVQLFVIPSS